MHFSEIDSRSISKSKTRISKSKSISKDMNTYKNSSEKKNIEPKDDYTNDILNLWKALISI